MNEKTFVSPTNIYPESWLSKNAVAIFYTVTVLTSVGIILLPMSMYVGPVLVVFIPTLMAAILIRLTEGKGHIRAQLFSKQAWQVTLRWSGLSLLLGIGLRLAVSLLGVILVPGYRLHSAPFTPLLVITLLFAAGEEIGWRGFALPYLLKRGASPLKAALVLGIPWGLMHLSLTMPGKLSAGTPPLATFLILLSMSVILTWLYLAAKGNILAPTLMHGGQNAAVILNDGLPLILNNWLMVLVYGVAAILILVFTRGQLGHTEKTE